ncbi:hypothetical protein [Sphingomonas jinjuensis]|uniref:hypothetical protein n=1 Tax=Sphingomonas jinjuensis TaxID=535907 RepID=UPI001C855D5B|nr:hypothetical protein [Sphingomonas jinjuensis]
MTDHRQFHYARAEAEREAAQHATCIEAVRVHCALADLHLALVEPEDDEGEPDRP